MAALEAEAECLPNTAVNTQVGKGHAGNGEVGHQDRPQGHSSPAQQDRATKRPAEDEDEEVNKRARLKEEADKEAKKRAKEVEDAHRKLCMTGLKGMAMDTLRGHLERTGIPFWKIWKKTNNDNAEMWLPEDKNVLLGSCRVLDNMNLKGKTVHIVYDNENKDLEPKPADGADVVGRTLIRQVSPLYDLEYPVQLAFKEACLLGSLRKLTIAMTSEHGPPDPETGKGVVPAWVRKARRGPCLDISKFHSSPTTRGYRNKNEFTIGCDRDKTPMVGFRYGRYIDGESGVGCADDCPSIPQEAVEVARCLRDFLVYHQKLEVWGPEFHTGVWRLLLIRNSGSNVLAMVQYSSKNCDAGELASTLEKMKEFFLEQVKLGKMKLTSLYVQDHQKISNKADADCTVKLLWGEETFYENLLSLRFRISPTAFFQVNTQAAEVLNSLIRDWACGENAKEKVVLDVCCGTGTIGICIASSAKQVVGIEMCEPAVEDAKLNAAANGIDNCVFMAGRAEAKIQEAITQYVPEGSSCVAVLDPPREGLNWRVLQAIRATPQIERIVYVSCNHVNFVEQAVKLCSHNTGKYHGEPFEPVIANGVDLFPDTPHVELVVLLERGETLKQRRAAEGLPEVETEKQ